MLGVLLTTVLVVFPARSERQLGRADRFLRRIGVGPAAELGREELLQRRPAADPAPANFPGGQFLVARRK